MAVVERVGTTYANFLPADAPVQYLDPTGQLTDSAARYLRPSGQRLVDMYRNMVLGRRFDEQATALTKQGRLAVYPSARGQEACQVAAAMSLRATDWMFPTYRDSMAIVTRGVDPVEILTMVAGDWHCGYDPARHRTAPHRSAHRWRPSFSTRLGWRMPRPAKASTQWCWRFVATVRPVKATFTKH